MVVLGKVKRNRYRIQPDQRPDKRHPASGRSVSTDLVNHASDKTRSAVDSINRVTQLIGEISQASVEQPRAVREVTQQNANLVKRLADTGELLLTRSTQLGDAISMFDLDDSLPAPSAPTRDEI